MRRHGGNSRMHCNAASISTPNESQSMIGGATIEITLLPYRRVPVLALNYLPSGVAAGPGLFQFGLAIEDEAQAIAERVYEDGFPRVAIVQSDLDWSGRAAESFRSQFVRLGGSVATVGTIQDAR